MQSNHSRNQHLHALFTTLLLRLLSQLNHDNTYQAHRPGNCKLQSAATPYHVIFGQHAFLGVIDLLPIACEASYLVFYLSNMNDAVAHRLLHPSESIRSIACDFEVSKSTLHNRICGLHDPAGVRAHGWLSLAQEQAIIGKINSYAKRGTLLEPRHIVGIARARDTALFQSFQPVGCLSLYIVLSRPTGGQRSNLGIPSW